MDCRVKPGKDEERVTIMATKKIRAAVLGASGYTGADMIRLAARHPNIAITALIAKGHAGQPLAQVFPHLATPRSACARHLRSGGLEQGRRRVLRVAACHRPQRDRQAPRSVKVIDMSADFRLRDPATLRRMVRQASTARPHLLKDAVYGLTEHYREKIKSARLVACPGCYPTAVLLALLPLAKAKLIEADGIIIDAKSGVSGAGRTLKQNILFSEAGEGLSPYGIGNHRHVPEIEQELGLAAGGAVTVNFTPHLVPMSRGELCTCYVAAFRQGDSRRSPARRSPRPMRQAPSCMWWRRARSPRPSMCAARIIAISACSPTASKVAPSSISAIDNLVKGSAGQALQNFNLMYGFDETFGLEQLPLFP